MATWQASPENAAFIGRIREARRLQRLIDDLGSGYGGALLILGEAGIGKTALLRSARIPPRTTVLRCDGGETDRERDYAGLRRLCFPLSAGVATLPRPQRHALERAFDPNADDAPDPFLVAAATLGLLSEASAGTPVLCVVDDAHLLDRPSSRAIAFAARRIHTARAAFLVAARPPDSGRTELAGLPTLPLTGLPERDARGLLSRRTRALLDHSVTDRVIAEAGGNPGVLLELSRTVGLSDPDAPSDTRSPAMPDGAAFRRRVAALPPDTRRFLLVAASEPTGNPLYLWRAVRHLGIGAEAAAPAEAAALLRVDLWIRFSHPLVRSIVRDEATPAERRTAHRALALATRGAHEPDRWIWHHAQSVAGPDEAVAGALERCASPDRAPGRAAVLLEAAARLTPDARERALRTLSAAGTQRAAGAHDAAERLLARVCSGPLDERLTAGVETLRARMALDRGHWNTAAGLLRRAAALLAPVDACLAREVGLDALVAAACAGRLATGPHAPEPADSRRLAPSPRSRHPLDLLLDALTDRENGDTAAVAPALERALRAYLDRPDDHPWGPGEAWAVSGVAIDLWDDSAWRQLTDRQVRDARRAGMPTLLPAALSRRALVHIHTGGFDAAAALLREVGSLPGDTGGWGVSCVRIALAAWRGDRTGTAAFAAEARRDAFARGDGHLLTAVSYARAVLFNGLGRPADAVRAWRSDRHLHETGWHTWGLVELTEAAARAGEPDLARMALDGVLRRTRNLSTQWALGVRLRSQALLSSGAEAGDLYGEAIRRLDLSDALLHAARGRLLYGEWLRAGGYRIEARKRLRQAYAVFAACGSAAFAARAARELRAAGEPIRPLRTERTDISSLTPQERRIVRLVAAGATSREVGAELNLSPRTVDAHVRSVFKKTGFSSRRQLRGMIPGNDDALLMGVEARQRTLREQRGMGDLSGIR
ncbi:AAA family ATPase [Streptomyces uncialis]|uniref:helix-turn-helix transcriptional regulator n=1 Tax=Streptomyces uncialis TaxID=1048205 RepID=UPI00380B2C1A